MALGTLISDGVHTHAGTLAGLLGVLENSRAQLMDVGAVHAAGQLEIEIRKEKHRMREVSREDPDVLLGLARIRDTRAEEERKRRLAIEDANRQVMTRQKLRREIIVMLYIFFSLDLSNPDLCDFLIYYLKNK